MSNTMESILTSVKKLLGITEEYEAFDADIIMHINTAFVRLYTLGVGKDSSNPFFITGAEETWDQFTGTDANDAKRNMVKTYIWTSVKMTFDPPSNSFVLDALKDQAERMEWLLMDMEEIPAFGGTSPKFDYDNYELNKETNVWEDGDK